MSSSTTRRGWIGSALAGVLAVLGIGRAQAAGGSPLRAVYRWVDNDDGRESWVRVRMTELRRGDIFWIADSPWVWEAVQDADTVPHGSGVWDECDAGRTYVRAWTITVEFHRRDGTPLA